MVADIMFEAAFGLPRWGEGIAMRSRRNRFIDDWSGREDELRRVAADIAPTFANGYRDRDVDYLTLLYGEGAGAVRSVRPAKDIVAQRVRDATDRLDRR